MILFVMSCAVFLMGIMGMANRPEVDEAELLQDENIETAAAVLGLLILGWALCVAVIINSLSAYLLGVVFMAGTLYAWGAGIDREQLTGKVLSTALDVSVVALAFLHIVTYIKPQW